MSEWLTKLKENSKLIKLKREMNGIIEEILKEDEMYIKILHIVDHASCNDPW